MGMAVVITVIVIGSSWMLLVTSRMYMRQVNILLCVSIRVVVDVWRGFIEAVTAGVQSPMGFPLVTMLIVTRKCSMLSVQMVPRNM